MQSNQSTAQNPQSSLRADGARLTEHLGAILERVETINAQLHGQQPKAVQNPTAGGAPPSTPTVRKNTDDAHRLVALINAELSGIESSL